MPGNLPGMDTPTTFRAGDSAGWTQHLTAYLPADGWLLKYRLLWPATGAAVDISTTVDGETYVVSLSSTDTASWTAGAATLVSFVERTGDRVTLAAHPVTILPDLSAATAHDGRSANEKALADAEAALAAHVASGQSVVAEYEVAGRKMKFRSVEELEKLIAFYRRAVVKDRAALALLNGGSVPGRVYYRG